MPYKRKEDKNDYDRQYRERNPEYAKKYRAVHKPKAKAARKAWGQENRGKLRKTWLKFKYGLTAKGYEELYRLQNGLCAICKRPIQHHFRSEELLSVHTGTVVDHDHKTGQVRGLLCRRCNLTIGYFEDNPELVMEAAIYLEIARSRQ